MIRWSNNWLLHFHPDKCKVVEMGNKRSKTYEYQIDGKKLKHETSEKDLGVITDGSLNFKEHIEAKIKKANSIAGLIRRSFSHLDEKMFKKLYVALVRPHLEYAQSVWSPQHEGDIKLIEDVQRRATRQVPTLKGLEYKERLRKLGLPSLRYRRLRGDMIECFKITNGYYDANVSDILLYADTVQTRTGLKSQTSKKLYFRTAKTNARNHNFTLRIVSPWNSLAGSIMNAPSLNSFKNRLDHYWKNEEILYDHTAKYYPENNIGRVEMKEN